MDGGENDLVNMLGAGSKHQCEFSVGIKRGGVGVEQDGAGAVTQGGATGLAGREHIQPAAAQICAQLVQLRALAATIGAFKGDEFAGSLNREASVLAGDTTR